MVILCTYDSFILLLLLKNKTSKENPAPCYRPRTWKMSTPKPNPFDQPFDELPNPRQVWVGTPGSHEEGLGRLALLTPEVVTEAAKEIQKGHRVALGWEMTKLEFANLNRHPCQHLIISVLNGVAFDDVYIMNPRGCLFHFRTACAI